MEMSMIKTLGIRYAVDNGAKVINGSLEKAFHHRQWVYDALKYEKKRCIVCTCCGK
jgi:NADH dehydrogenase/NADH:ubiquinone oxidoreductase subunit G